MNASIQKKFEIDEDKYKLDHGIRPREVELPRFQDPSNEV